MPAYMVFEEVVHDHAMFDEYRKDVPTMVAAHGGRFIVRGGNLTVMEGEWPFPRFVVIEFPTRAAAEAWYHSPEYQKVLPLRLKSTTGNCMLVDGV